MQLYDDMISALHSGDDNDDVEEMNASVDQEPTISSPTPPESSTALPLTIAAPQVVNAAVTTAAPTSDALSPPPPSVNSLDAMIPTTINTPSTPNNATAAPMAVARPQQAVSAATLVQATKTPVIATAPPVQAVAQPKVAGGNLVLQGAGEQPVPAVQMTQTQGAPQLLTPVSWLKTGA